MSASSASAEILPASLLDLWEVWALEHLCFGPDAWGLLELIIALLTPSVRLKVMLDSRLVGFAIGETHALQNEGWVITLGIHPEHQGHGLGRRLLAAVEARLAPDRLKLTVRVSNTRAIALYEQSGYRTVHRVARYYSGGEDGLVMEKQRSASV